MSIEPLDSLSNAYAYVYAPNEVAYQNWQHRFMILTVFPLTVTSHSGHIFRWRIGASPGYTTADTQSATMGRELISLSAQ